MRKVAKADVEALRSSGLFNSTWYLESYPDVTLLGMDPIEHYLSIGAKLNRDPSPNFDATAYLEEYRDVASAGLNPLLHYVQLGMKEGRSIESIEAFKARSAEIRQTPQVQALNRISKLKVPAAIIVPIYNAPKETEDCIRSVLRHTDASIQLILIDDASPDPAVQEVLSRYSDLPNVVIVRNDVNLGFVKTVNRGIVLAGNADVIFLNSDTKVTPLWLRNLQLAVYSDERIATATPLSNNAGAFSAPEIGKENPLPAALGLDDFARLVTRTSERLYPRVPTGNGFCMYVRRACIEEIGLLDSEAFPRGYGEENDFCMRAGRKGWSHVIDDATVIYHVRSASFGDERTSLAAQGRAILDQRYPEYTKAVHDFIADPVAGRARKNVADASNRLTASDALRPRILFVVSTRTGGTPQTNEDLMSALQDRYETFLLRCNSRKVELFSFVKREYVLLEGIRLNTPIAPFPHVSTEYDGIARYLLLKYSFEIVHIRHLAWHSLNLPAICKSLHLPVVFSFHDFYTVCPTVKLLDERLEFCGGVCTKTPGDCRQDLWNKEGFPRLKNEAVHDWQKAMNGMLRYCDRYVTTSAGAQEQITKIFQDISSNHFSIIPHGRDLMMSEGAQRIRNDTETVRILVPGNINSPKGAKIIKALAEMEGPIGFEFHILGNTSLKARSNLVIHGGYNRADFNKKVEEIKPHLGAIFSVWPETFCHTHVEMWGCGLPVIALDLGAVGERIRVHGGGWLLSSKEPKEIFRRLLKLADDCEEQRQKIEEVRSWQRKFGRTQTTMRMSHAYDELYREVLLRRACSRVVARRPRIGVVVPSLDAASSHVRVLEKIRDRFDRPVRYDVVPKSDIGDEEVVREFDALLVQRTAVDSATITAFLQAVGEHRKKLLYEIDDDLPAYEGREDRIDYSSGKSAVLQLLRRADTVLTSTEALAERFGQHNHRVVVCENALSERLWFSPFDDNQFVTTDLGPRDSEEVRIIYMGTKTHEEDLLILEEPIKKLREENPGIRLFTVGVTSRTDSWYETLQIPNKYKAYPHFVPWFRQLASQMDLAVAPLKDTHFNKGKSPLKFLEYAAAGICGLYSQVEPYVLAVEDCKTGYLVQNSTDAWVEALNRAIENSTEREQIATNAYADVAATHGMRNQARRLDDLVLELLQSYKVDRQVNAERQARSSPSGSPIVDSVE